MLDVFGNRYKKASVAKDSYKFLNRSNNNQEDMIPFEEEEGDCTDQL